MSGRAESALNNWNRWGADDERGAANLISPELLLSALRVARSGEVVSLADEIRRDRVPVAPARSPATHLMSLDGGDFAAGFQLHGSTHGVADDYLFMACQGSTHVDALGHLWYDGQLYNGFPADRVRSYGATRLGIENLGHLIGRGVFL
ncbi:MAG TPA: cyclase family protein, partial [Pseudonocardia sp.]